MLSSLLYCLYEQRLAASIWWQSLPRRIGMILDGNRRFARQLGLADFIQGHERGARGWWMTSGVSSGFGAAGG